MKNTPFNIKFTFLFPNKCIETSFNMILSPNDLRTIYFFLRNKCTIGWYIQSIFFLLKDIQSMLVQQIY